MIWKVLDILASKENPEVGRLRKVIVVFFALWVTDLFLSIYCECLLLSVNAYVVFNVWVTLVAAALSHLYGYSPTAIPSPKSNKNLLRSNLPSSPVKGGNDQQEPGLNYAGGIDSFCFALKRLHVLVSFGSAVFVMFGCLMVFGECLHHAFHPHHTSPIILLVIGVSHAVLFSLYGREIDIYDRISGRGVQTGETYSVSPGHILRPLRQLRRRLATLLKTTAWRSGVIRGALRAFVPLSCLMVYLLAMICESHVVELTGALLLSACVFVVTLARAEEMAWMLLNNAVRQPSLVAACERAVRGVKLIDGVLQVQSSVFWEVGDDQLMALVHLCLMSSADARSVTRAARQILEGVATYVFVETRMPNEEDDGAFFMEEGECGHDHGDHDGCGHHHHHHSVSYVHEHGHGGVNVIEPAASGTIVETTLKQSKAPLSAAPATLLPFPQPPNTAAADTAGRSEQQSRPRAAFTSGSGPMPTLTQSFNFVPPPFPKPPS
ncbi:hypothetical protein DQ04_00281210 [Trypanosoma grayi]|uniref:hypothetical protein n=1 Tax=Trypanosoma grayi TaxID=71804 RepID=UPI0004F4B881|nr:hypothetical protein DQ04_00281210 [Trypanosoma grayi]KEG14858.1 hypothetical protein DQ04_00281210 [Trypanosoma grayi]